MDGELRYCTSADGTRIAYMVFSDHPGIPIIQVTSWVFPIAHASFQDSVGAWYERPGSTFRLISYDRRGVGASQRDRVHDFSLEAQTSDLAAVVDHLALDEFFLIGFMDGTAAATAYAATHPSRVRRLILNSPLPRGADPWEPETLRALLQLVPASWPMAARMIGELLWSHEANDSRRANVRSLVSSCSPDVASAYLQFWAGYDVTAYLPKVQAPTLVVTVGVNERTVAGARNTAALMLDARCIDLDTHAKAVDAVLRFLKDEQPLRLPSSSRAALSGTAVILFTDVAGSTSLTERMGDAAFRLAASALDERMRAAIWECGGTPVEGKVLGDGLMAVFTSAAQAIGAARRCVALSAESELRLHVGIHAGDVIHEKNNVYGGAVNIASRICELCEPGEIMVSQTIRDLARTSASVTFHDRGEQLLKGITDPIRVFVVVPGD
ncbi:MAG: adenylate/guanylate cyclase domain-containing protein [Dehalococcoidia bacterium]